MRSSETEAAPAPGEIIDRGRGPEIKGTRITVYDILDYALECWPPERIAGVFDITASQVQAAVEYVREHKIEVLTHYVRILERCERGNPPELQAKLDAGHQKFLELVEKIRQVRARGDGEITELIRAHRQRPAEETAYARPDGGP